MKQELFVLDGQYPIGTISVNTSTSCRIATINWGDTGHVKTHGEALANAELIRKAVNNYDSLLSALKEVVAAFPLGQYNVKKDFSKLVTLAAVNKAIHKAEQ